jgi:hypothetical protein
MKDFYNRKSYKIISWGYCFDSILELKYAVSIQKDYEYLRSHIPIYFDPRTNLPTSYIRDNIRRYTPDFLIRHKISGEAFLVETKPREFEGNHQLEVRREIAENYIRWKSFDWKFKIVFDDEIWLNGDEYALFEESRKLKARSARKLKFKAENDRFDRSQGLFFNGAPSNSLIRFVMFGERKQKSGGVLNSS